VVGAIEIKIIKNLRKGSSVADVTFVSERKDAERLNYFVKPTAKSGSNARMSSNDNN